MNTQPHRAVSPFDLTFDACDYLRSWSNEFGDGTVAEGLVGVFYHTLPETETALVEGDCAWLASELARLYVIHVDQFRSPKLKFIMEGTFADLLTEHRDMFLQQVRAANSAR